MHSFLWFEFYQDLGHDLEDNKLHGLTLQVKSVLIVLFIFFFSILDFVLSCKHRGIQTPRRSLYCFILKFYHDSEHGQLAVIHKGVMLYSECVFFKWVRVWPSLQEYVSKSRCWPCLILIEVCLKCST